MTRLYLVRHGRAAAGWDTDPDPGLDDIGQRQATAVAATARPVRATSHRHQPAAALSGDGTCRWPTTWGVVPRIEPAVAEIPSPEGVAMADRIEWLREAMRGHWADLGGRYVAYRDQVVGTLGGNRTATRSSSATSSPSTSPSVPRSATIGWSFAASTTAR